MKKEHLKKFYFNPFCNIVLYLCLLLFSCTKHVNVAGAQGPQGPQGNAGVSDSALGNIQGRVQLYDVNGNALANNSGATVLEIRKVSPIRNLHFCKMKTS